MTKRNDIESKLLGLMRPMRPMRLMGLMGLMLLLWALPQAMLAQDAPESPTEVADPDPDPQPIIVNGNVYGGGNKGRVDGNTTVTVVSGDLNKVFGGARMANVGGRSFVHIDGENTTEYIMANQVYGGNDISGTIGEGSVATTVPEELTAVMPATLPAGKTEADYPKKNKIDNTWKTFVRVSGDAEEIVPAKGNNSTKHAVYIGTLFAGGNGEYEYTEVTGTNEANATSKTYNVFQKNNSTAIATITVPKNAQNKYVYLPEVPKTYMEINGGSIIYAFGGGNNATVTQATVINVDNPTKVVSSIKDPNNPNPDKDSNNELLTDARVLKMGINPGLSHPNSDAFQIGSLFGGNNAAAMAIMPTWNLQSGKIRNVYSGGNRGDMISRNGILLTVKPAPMNDSSPYVFDEAKNDYPLVIDNVYGGCRIADVRPQVWNNEEDKYDDVEQVYNLDGYHFPHNLAARTLVYGGDINNVYGGNDIRGKVYFGNAVGIYTSIRGNVYGGGNGSYPYTDNEMLENDPTYGDLYYDPDKVLQDANITATSDELKSVEALNLIRPHAEQVSIRLAGEETKKTIIHGSVFVGGNSATLKRKETTDESYTPLIELKIGSHVIAENVFLGNNGEEMVAYNEIGKDNDDNEVQDALEGVLRTMVRTDKTSDQSKYSSLDLTNATTFAEYMEGAAMDMIPKIVFDDEQLNDPATYIDYSSQIGSLYLGGNVGSMTYAGKNTMQLNTPIYIYNKFVGGCNNADVPIRYLDKKNKTGQLNAAYEGGILGYKGTIDNVAVDERASYTENGQIKDRIELNFNGLRVRPQRWAMFHNNQTDKDEYYLNEYDQEYLEWNTVKWNQELKKFEDTDIGYGDNTSDDKVRRLIGGNIYGGCYNSGHVNGNVVININSDVHERDVLFAKSATDENGNTSIDIESEDNRRTGVILENQRDDLMAVALSVFGAGKGAGTEIWGSTTVNLIKGYAFQAYGGGEEGVVGKGTIVKDSESNTQYDTDGFIQKAYNDYNEAYSSTVNLSGTKVVYSSETAVKDLAEAEYLYGGGNEGNVCGDTYVNLGNGRIYDVFGGASNADVYGRAQVAIGHNDGFPWVIDNVYGGNDFGGTIWAKGENKSFIDQVRTSGNTPLIYNTNLAESSTYVKYLQGHVDSIFGGSYGHYDYTDPLFDDYTDENGQPINGFTFPHLEKNSFVHFVPNDNSNNKVSTILGGSTGWPGSNISNIINNGMQEESYVLIDDTKTTDESRFNKVDVYGGGAYAGVGKPGSLGTGRTIVDLYAGSINSVYGGCNQEGLVGYTLVNVPTESKIKLNSIFGGSKGYDAEKIAEKPELSARYCDNYVTIVDFKGANTIVNDAIYGGNRNCRISCDTYINIEAPVMQSSGYQATIYGAGYGTETVSGRTNVFMNSGSVAYKVFGGGRDGNVFNFASLQKWLASQFLAGGTPSGEVQGKVNNYGQILHGFETFINGREADNEHTAIPPHPIALPANTGTYVNSETGKFDGKYTIDIMTNPNYYQTNVHLMQGSRVTGYAYGGGLGSDAVVGGTTYIELKGGIVDRDIYGGGQGGSVMDEYELAKETDFVATTNVYIEGGMARNVYGGGYMGHVGKHTDTSGKSAEVQDSYENDILGVANVVIGKLDGTSFMDGIPAISRNVYGAGEGGSVWGTTNVTINNGYVGYRTGYVAVEAGPLTQGNVYYMDDYGVGKFEATGNETVDETHKYYYLPTEAKYVEELLDNGSSIDLAGNVFGGGYVVNSYVDETYVKMYGGTLRGCLFGGGEVGPIGRGTVRYKDTYTTGLVNGDARIYKAGKTHVTLFDGHVKRNVFGGGRGKDSWGGDGTMYMKQNMTEEAFASLDLQCKGFVFGQTEVNIHGGEVGTDEGVVLGYGNVFGGGDVGCVYSAYMDANGKLAMGKKSGKRYNEGITEGTAGYNDEGYYYKWEKSGENYSFGTTKTLTEDCKVLVEPWLKTDAGITINENKNENENSYGYSYTAEAGGFVPTVALNYLGNKTDERWNSLGHTNVNQNGIIIHNAVFAGGNTPPGSTEMYANAPTVFGNATASINDVYHRDLITIGRGRVGGLYGDGNLTLVDGYRELNITNYGTDYYSITNDISKTDYDALPKREQAYYEIRYKCTSTCQDKNERTYTPGSTITADELLTKFIRIEKVNGVDTEVSLTYGGKAILKHVEQGWVPNDAEGATFWVQNGVFSRYAGRPMNTIQRADFCGVFGSRMVMQGAQDRVPETVDYTNYTINRVREVSLNKKGSVRTADANNAKNKEHGNYFGIYNVVNFLGALTSDVDFKTTRTTESANTNHLPDIDPNKVTITATTSEIAAAVAEKIDGISANGTTLTAANAKALYALRSQGIQGVTIKPDPDKISITAVATTTATATDVATEAAKIEGISANGTTLTAASIDAYYQLRAAKIEGIEMTSIELTNQTFYDWKAIHHEEKTRNNGTCHNKVALASGVHLELTTEQSTGPGLYEKEWGLITGVVELDLINVQPGVGGGFVYAKNIHGVRESSGKTNTLLSDLNLTGGVSNTPAVTNKIWKYIETDNTANNTQEEWETSGNFIHSTQTIIDDCYNIGAKYKLSENPVPAHYWFVKGSVYVYDQYISAYTGSPNAFSETVNIPLTITSASHGQMKLMDVMPNYYAYFANTNTTPKRKLEAEETIELRDKVYQLNDPITYWEYFMLNDEEKAMFVKKTYVTTDSCKIENDSYPSGYVTIPSGYVMLPDEYEAFMTAAEEKQIETNGPVVKAVKMMTKDKSGNDIEETDKDDNPIYKAFSDIFRSSNNMSHSTGYILTYKIDNPNQWNQWYTKETSTTKNQDGGTDYIAGPTYHPTTPGLYGQQDYKVGNIISKDIYKAYAGLDENNDGQISGDEQGLMQLHQTAIPTNDPTAEGYDPDKVQAEFEPAYIVTKDVLETGTLRLYKGATLGQSSVTSELYTAGEDNNSVEPAYIVTSTIQLDKTKFIYRGTYMTKAEKDKYITDYGTLATDIDKSIVPAYYCKTAGKYGGNYYVTSQNYYAKEAFSELSAEDRAKFAFNYDALDLLIDSTYSRKYAEGAKYQYDSKAGTKTGAEANDAHYSLPTSIDYEATYRGGGTLMCGTKEITDGVTITGKEYESLLNERYYYVPIDVKKTKIGGTGTDADDSYPYYVVNKTMMLGDTPYAAGQVIDKETYDNMSSEAQQNITTLYFDDPGIYYYCREGYKIAPEPTTEGEKGGYPVTDIAADDESTKNYTYGDSVYAGVIITKDNFTNLTNNQANFVIHGTAPTETSTLFVTRNSDIKDLSQEKIITVVYEYNYVESDMSGMNIVPVSERHVLNIHINFKSGIPTIEDIKAPDIVLPGTSVSLQAPFVQPGAYEVTGSGWELFDDPADAVSHINGIEYTPNVDPLYLYQNNYWVSYYAKTYLGKTYSNAVQVSVANYHDLKKVMSALTNHYYIDHPDLYKDNNNIIKPKIYINDYSKDETGKKDGLDLFKDLYDLSVLNKDKVNVDAAGLITTDKTTNQDSPFKGHKLLNNVTGGKHLEFILHSNINHDPTKPWTPIAGEKNTSTNQYINCFEGTLHGDGYTISGLSESLFGKLCGDIYNLGVTGTFTGAGIAEEGEGYIENGWISTTSTEDKTTQPVFGNPNREDTDARGKIQVVNSYYMEEDAVAGTDGSYAKQITDNNVSAHGTPIRKPAKAFYNGEVTYDLNGFYLYKRYNDHEKLSGSTYHYWLPGNDKPQEGAYASNPTWSSAGANNVMYVEDRFADGDFRYADGTIPESKDKHEYSYTVDDENSTENGKIKHEFYPIYPEDYIFFGQRLTYGYSETKDHDPLPSAVSDDNHVYRAPAYFRNSEMGVAHFNPDAILAAKSKDGTREAYPGMTAIDFAGHNDIHDETNGADKPYQLGNQAGLFYPPLLDDDGLTSIMNADETRNLLVYAPAETSESEYANKMTYDILNGYFVDPKYTTYSDENTSADKKYNDGKKYGRVAIVPDNNIYGHVVQRNLKSTNDHFLVDRQDFNAPFAYQFLPSTGSDEGTRMWYQREPDNYVEFAWSDDATPVRSSKGWEGVSIPFEAEVVTTDQKGEITHFYRKSADSGYERGYDSGHEYWLRQFTDIDSYDATEHELKAIMVYPTAGKSDDTKEVKNQFLWDYYYEAVTGHKHKDNNDDTYQTYYEQETRQYANYPHLTSGTPYIIGLPGKSYYEFDLSGTFRPTTTASPTPAVLDAQTITFASMPGATIGVSDGEKAGVEHKGYTFVPSYLNEELTNGNYVLNGDGDAYTKLDNTGTGKYHTTGKTYADATAFAAAGTLYTDEEGTTVATEWANAETVYYTRGSEKTKNEINNVTPSLSAFRPYFTGTYNPSSNPAPRRIIFSGADDKLQKDLEERHSGDDDGGLIFSVDKRDIVVESTRRDNATVRITTTSGVVVSTFTIEPGQIVRTTVNMTGVYMGNRTKLIVK